MNKFATLTWNFSNLELSEKLSTYVTADAEEFDALVRQTGEDPSDPEVWIAEFQGKPEEITGFESEKPAERILVIGTMTQEGVPFYLFCA